MEQIRGRVPLNIDLYNNKNSNYLKPEKVYDMHHNKNHNVFEDKNQLYTSSPSI